MYQSICGRQWAMWSGRKESLANALQGGEEKRDGLWRTRLGGGSCYGLLNLLYSSPDLSLDLLLDLQLSPGPCPGSLPVACIQSPVSFWLETHVSFRSPFLNLPQPRPCTSLPSPLRQAGFHCSVRLLPRLGDLRLGFIWVNWTPVKILVS